jgi:hypothetical protein
MAEKGTFETPALRKLREAFRVSARIDIITVQAKIERTFPLSRAWPQ